MPPVDLINPEEGSVDWATTVNENFDKIEAALNEAPVARLQFTATDRLAGRDLAGSGAGEELTVGGGLEFTGSGGIQRSALTGDVTASAGSGTATIANDAVTDAKLRNSGALSIIGRATNSSGDPGDISAGSDGDVLRRSGTSLGFGAIPESSVTNLVSDLASKVASSRSVSTTAPLTGGGDLSSDRTLGISDFVGSGASHARGAVPDPGASAGSTKFLREDATWAVPSGGSASVTVGPASGAGSLGSGVLYATTDTNELLIGVTY